MYPYISILLIISSLFLSACIQQKKTTCEPQKIEKPSSKMGGLTLVAPPRPFEENPMLAIKKVNANWVAVIPYGYTIIGKPQVFFDTERQWWGEREAGILESIRKAKAENVKIMLKPQVYVPGDWTGTLDFESDEDWTKWEASYTIYALRMAEIAAAEKVDLYCFGTEFKKAIRERPAYWVNLIRAIRRVYQGKLTYASNWDNYHNIPFWSELDYVGINAYFPLSEAETPTKTALLDLWKPIAQQIEHFHCEINQPIIFTEFGYLSVNGSASKTWELENNIHNIDINEMAQANALDALYETFWEKDWWQGGFLWKWFPDMKGHEGYPEKDYTPQGKEAEKVVTKWYGKN